LPFSVRIIEVNLDRSLSPMFSLTNTSPSSSLGLHRRQNSRQIEFCTQLLGFFHIGLALVISTFFSEKNQSSLLSEFS